MRKSENGELLGYKDSTIAELLAVNGRVFTFAIAKMIQYDKISVNKNNVITITNWGKYQSEYSRQKQYRDKESHKKNCNFDCNESNSLDIDRDIERDKEQDKERIVLIVERWNLFSKKNNLPAIMNIKSNRLVSLRARLKEKEFEFDMILEMIEKSPHLLGENERGWTVTFDWILNPSNYIKIIEGQYLKRKSQSKTAGQRWLERKEKEGNQK